MASETRFVAACKKMEDINLLYTACLASTRRLRHSNSNRTDSFCESLSNWFCCSFWLLASSSNLTISRNFFSNRFMAFTSSSSACLDTSDMTVDAVVETSLPASLRSSQILARRQQSFSTWPALSHFEHLAVILAVQFFASWILFSQKLRPWPEHLQ